MNSIVKVEKPSFVTDPDDRDASDEFAAQINPPTLMTSATPFEPVDDNQENVLAYDDGDVSRFASSDADQPTNLPDPVTSTNVCLDVHSIAAWVETTTTESTLGAMERSPSLPSTLNELPEVRDRRNSTVSTLCDQPTMSYTSEVHSSQQASLSGDVQRSLSMPLPSNESDDDRKYYGVSSTNDDDTDDMSTKFQPVPESEDSEIEKKLVKLSLIKEPSIEFESRSPKSLVHPKKPSHVSFDESISPKTDRKLSSSSSTKARRRHTASSANKATPNAFQRSQSHVAPKPSSPSLQAQLLRRQFHTAMSMPNQARQSPGGSTRQTSHQSDNVFHSVSQTNTSPLSNDAQMSPDSRFLALPSSASMVSDASGQSGIESSNLRTSQSDLAHTSSINEQDTRDRKYRYEEQFKQRRAGAARSSATPSTESLSSSSDDEMHPLGRNIRGLNINRAAGKGSANPRRAIVIQLMWLLQQKPSIHTHAGSEQKRLSSRAQLPSAKSSHQHHKSASNIFAQVMSRGGGVFHSTNLSLLARFVVSTQERSKSNRSRKYPCPIQFAGRAHAHQL